MKKLLLGALLPVAILSSVIVDIESGWEGLKFGNETGTITYKNETKNQRQIDGLRVTLPNTDPSAVSGQGTFEFSFVVNDGSPRLDMLIGDKNGGAENNNLPKNIMAPDKIQTFTLSTSSVDSGDVWIPEDVQVLIIGGKSLAEKKVNKDITGITIEELDSIAKTDDFYNENLYVLDTLGIRGSEWGAGFIDTWVDQETEEPIWQIQVCEIPFIDTTVTPVDTFRFWNENKAFLLDSLDVDDDNYGATKRPFYMMGLAMTQEYMNIDMQSLMGKGFQESNAGLSMGISEETRGDFDTTYKDTTLYKIDTIKGHMADDAWVSESYDTTGTYDSSVVESVVFLPSSFEIVFDKVKYSNRASNHSQGMGPMHYEESTYKGQIFEPYPKFFPFENGVYQNSGKFINSPKGGSPLNHPSIVNAYLISSLNMWYTWQLVVAAIGEDALELMKNTSNRRLMGDMVNYAWNAGVNGPLRQAFEEEGIEFLYLDQINYGINHIEDASRRSVLVKSKLGEGSEFIIHLSKRFI